MRYDLHCHSSFSDGLLSPEALLAKAIENEVQCLALTDHDTIAGLPSLHAAAQGLPIRIIDGIEFSVRFKTMDVHILGLQINRHDPHLMTLIAQQEQSRIVRAQEIGARLALVKVHDAYQKVVDRIGHPCVGRPHFAKLLVEEGLASDLQQAFKRYLVRGRIAYVPTAWLSIEDVVAGIVQAKGCAVIAHPFKYSLTRTKLHALINQFKLAGGQGMEVVSGMITPALILDAAGLCKRFELYASSGSDYHGEGMSRVGLGRQQQLPDSCTPIWHNWT